MEPREFEPRVLPLGVIARKLRVGVFWLEGEAEAGRVPAYKAGKIWLGVLEDVEEALFKQVKGKGMLVLNSSSLYPGKPPKGGQPK